MPLEGTLLPQDQTSSPAMRLFLIASVFTLIGPMVGGLVVWGMFLVNGALGRPERWPDLLGFFLLLAYPFGAPFALLAGLVHAISAIWVKKTGFMLPVVAALIVTAPVLLIRGWLSTADQEFPFHPMVVFPASLVASFVCWRLTRNLLRAA